MRSQNKRVEKVHICFKVDEIKTIKEMCNRMLHSEGKRHLMNIVSPCCKKHSCDITGGGKVKSCKKLEK